MKRIKLPFLINSGVTSLLLTVTSILSGQSDKAPLLPQFLFPDFSNCSVRMENGQTQNSVMNYNVVSERMVYMKDGEYFDVINAEQVDTVIIKNRIFIPFRNTFLELMPTSSIELFIEHKGTLSKPGLSVGYGATSETATGGYMSSVDQANINYNLPIASDYNVKLTKVYWIRMDNQMSFFLNEKQFLKLFSGKTELIKQYIRKNRLKFEKQADVIQIVNYSTTLK